MKWRSALIISIALVSFSGSGLAAQPADPAICLPNVSTQRVLSMALPSGAQRQVDEFRLDLGLQAALPVLAATLERVASPGYLMRRRAGQWRTLSFWLQKRFCVIQLRAAGVAETHGLLTLTDYSRTLSGPAEQTGGAQLSSELKPPPWWPSLHRSKVERWLDTGRRVMTITGFANSSLSQVRERIIRATTRAGFVPSAQMLVPAAALGRHRANRSGLMLMFQSPDRALAVTLTAVSRVTIVIAHLEER